MVMIYLVLAVLFLHIISAPIALRFALSIDSESRRIEIAFALFFVTVFKKSVDFDTIESNIYNRKAAFELREKAADVKEIGRSEKLKSFIIAVAKNMLARITVRDIRLDGTLGLSDAAVNAVACSLFNIVYSQACAFFGLPCRNGLYASDGKITEVSVGCIISVTIADIIIALICSLFARSLHERNRGIQRASD